MSEVHLYTSVNFWSGNDLIRICVYDEYSGSTKITAHLDQISHCKFQLVKNGRIDEPIESSFSILTAIGTANPTEAELETVD
jgi:hypothetical protein